MNQAECGEGDKALRFGALTALLTSCGAPSLYFCANNEPLGVLHTQQLFGDKFPRWSLNDQSGWLNPSSQVFLPAVSVKPKVQLILCHAADRKPRKECTHFLSFAKVYILQGSYPFNTKEHQ